MAERNYAKERANYHAQPVQKARNAARTRARRAAIKAGIVKRGDGKDLAHKDGNPFHNAMNNWAVQSPSTNRSFARTATSRKVNPRD